MCGYFEPHHLTKRSSAQNSFDSRAPLLGTHSSQKVGQIDKCESTPQNLSYKIKNQETSQMSIF